MIRLVDQRGAHQSHAVPRAGTTIADVMADVVPIVREVERGGPEAALEWGEQFDRVRPASVRVPADVLQRCLAALPPEVRAALTEAAARVRRVHADEAPRSATTTVTPGGSVTQRWIPVDRVGLYVPGGRAVYPSSVIMNVVPAQVAGVGSVVVASPPHRDNDGWPNATVLATCALLGVDEVWAVGGAQAIALLAHGGTSAGETCLPVALVTGPGNVWVTAAKRLIMGKVGIDSEAGPTEIMVIADDTADAGCVAADLVSQAEHDPLAAAVLVTDSADLAEAVVGELARQVAATKHRERITEALAGPQSAILLVDDLAAAIGVANAYGAEHLEIHTRDAQEVADRISNAGAIFVGPYSPVSLGDYAAGSNHVLPTGGSAAHASGLGVHTFLRAVQTISYDRRALAEVVNTVTALAAAEDLPAHAAAVHARFGDGA